MTNNLLPDVQNTDYEKSFKTERRYTVFVDGEWLLPSNSEDIERLISHINHPVFWIRLTNNVLVKSNAITKITQYNHTQTDESSFPVLEENEAA